MKVETLRYAPDTGWSQPNFPELDSEQTLVLAFAAPEFAERRAPLDELRAAYPKSLLVGCSTAGEVRGGALTRGTIIVAIARFEHSRLKLVSVELPEIRQTYNLSLSLARQLLAPDLRGAYVLCDGLQVLGNQIIRAFGDVFPRDVEVGGGLAADGDNFQTTWTWRDGEPRHREIMAIGFYGDKLEFHTGAFGGYDEYGPSYIVTRSDANALFELDGEPALDVTMRALGVTDPDALMAQALLHPLSLIEESDLSRVLLRALVAVDQENGACIYAGDIPCGAQVRFTSSDHSRVIEGAAQAARQTCREDAPSGTSLSIATSCITRRWFLGEQSTRELEAAFEAMPEHTEQVGFYSYGEFTSVAGVKDLQNQTMTIARISERVG